MANDEHLIAQVTALLQQASRGRAPGPPADPPEPDLFQAALAAVLDDPESAPSKAPEGRQAPGGR
jgi:hypothetical protein